MKWSAMTILAFALFATNAVSQETTKEINPVPVNIQRVDTEGGVAPPGTSEKSRQGEEVCLCCR